MKEFSDTVYWLSLCFTGFSDVCLLLMIFCVLFSTLFDKPGYRLVVYSSLSILVLSNSLMIPKTHSGFLCALQGFLNSFGCLSVTMWTSVLMHSLYSEILYEKIHSELYYITLCVVIPMLVTLPEVFMTGFSYGSGWCVLDIQKFSDYYIILTVFTPFIVCSCFNITVFFRILSFIKMFDAGYRTEEYLEKESMFITLRKFPICINICLILPAIYRYYYLNNRIDNQVIDIVAVVGESLIGYMYALCFVVNFMKNTKRIADVSIVSSARTLGQTFSVNSEFKP